MNNRYMDVHTDDGIYKLIIDDTSDALIDVVNAIINDLNVPGVAWYGWTPYDDPNDDANIIVFGADISIKSVKVYEISDLPKVTPTERPKTGPTHKNIDVMFLGNTHTLSCWCLSHDDGTGFDILPYAVDGVPTPNAISTENLCTCISAYYEEQGIPASDYRVITTDVPMGCPMARDYIQARSKNVVQTTTTNTPGKGKPWYGWNDNEV